MTVRRRSLSHGTVLLVGLAIGWGLATGRPARLQAEASDRWGDRILMTGPIAIEQNAQKTPIPQDALYYLNYNTGMLLAAIPSYQQTTGGTQILTDFAERDLIRDFDLKPGVNPHFLMTTGSLGFRTEGWAPLFVVETETGQVAVYKVSAQATVGSSKPNFQLLERKHEPRLGRR